MQFIDPKRSFASELLAVDALAGEFLDVRVSDSLVAAVVTTRHAALPLQLAPSLFEFHYWLYQRTRTLLL